MIRPGTLVLTTLTALGACSASTQIEKRFSDETLSMIQPGDSADAVTFLLGEPTSKTAKSDGTVIWKWSCRQNTASSGAVLFAVGGAGSGETGTVYVQLRDGVVVKVWRD